MNVSEFTPKVSTGAAATVDTAGQTAPKTAREIVHGVLVGLFGPVAANTVEYSKSADGTVDLVNLTSLPHVDRGWAGGIRFYTRSGEKTLREVRGAIMDAQKQVGIASPIQ